jgi:protein MBA1
MAEALASGDRDTINRICSRKLAATLIASIDGRPRGRRYGWELVAYTNKLFYPSVKSHRLTLASNEKKSPILRQAVVAISSRQRRVEYDARGQVIPGSEKEIEAVENLVLMCTYDHRTWTQGEWRILGTIKPTSAEQWKHEGQLMRRLALNRG